MQFSLTINGISRIFTPYVTTSCVFGTGIACVNLFNIKKSPKYDKCPTMMIAGMSLFKGWIYGVFMPFAIFGISVNVLKGDINRFNSHFIPYSSFKSDKL